MLAEALNSRLRKTGEWGSSHHSLSRSDPGPLAPEMVRAPRDKARSTVHKVSGEGTRHQSSRMRALWALSRLGGNPIPSGRGPHVPSRSRHNLNLVDSRQREPVGSLLRV